MRTLFLLPGFKQSATDAQFKWLIKFLREKRIRIVGVPIQWNHKTLSTCADNFVPFYEKNKSKNNYVLGFSYGAVIALITANQLKPNKIYLCSLSPEFREDVGKMRTWIQKLVGKKRLQDAKTRSGRTIAKQLKIPSVVFCGSLEAKKYPELKIRSEETARLAKNSKLIVVRNAPHKLNHPEYVAEIKKELGKI